MEPIVCIAAKSVPVMKAAHLIFSKAARLSSQYADDRGYRAYISSKSSYPFVPRTVNFVMKLLFEMEKMPPLVNCSRPKSEQPSQGAIAFKHGGFLAAMKYCVMAKWELPAMPTLPLHQSWCPKNSTTS